jgi:phosphoglycerate dehydrogenase-like enzyme
MGEPSVVLTVPGVDPEVARQALDPPVTVRSVAGLDPDERRRTLADAEVIVVGSWAREVRSGELVGLPARFVQLLSAGADQVDFDALPEGAVVASNVGGWAEPMAEHVLAMVLALRKRLAANHAKLAAGVWEQSMTASLAGSTALIVGYGGIGRATARLLAACGVTIHAINTRGRTDDPLVARVGTVADLAVLLPDADVVVLSLPLTAATHHLIGPAELAAMRPDAILVNVARGAVVDEAALYDHLVRHPTMHAALDVWWAEPMRRGVFRVDHPFLSLPNVLGSPHNSALVPGAQDVALSRAMANVARYLRGEPITGRVDPADYR